MGLPLPVQSKQMKRTMCYLVLWSFRVMGCSGWPFEGLRALYLMEGILSEQSLLLSHALRAAEKPQHRLAGPMLTFDHFMDSRGYFWGRNL